MPKFQNLVGQRFGNLLVVKRTGVNKFGQSLWLCRCDCGNEKIASLPHLRTGAVKSCGCLHRMPTTKTHGKRNTRLYSIWANMKQRCYNSKNPDFKLYGGRRITICDEWKNNFQNFYNWAMNNGYSNDLTIDRIDVNGNYEPTNCRWATVKEQCNNRRNNVYVIINDKKKTIKQIADETGVSEFTLYSRARKYLEENK